MKSKETKNKPVVFPDQEMKFLSDKNNVSPNQRTNLRKRIIERMLQLKNPISANAMKFLSEEERWEIVQNLMNEVDLEIINNWIFQRIKEEKELSSTIDLLHLDKEIFNELKKTTSTKLKLEEVLVVSKFYKGKLKSRLRELFHSKQFILKRKLQEDKNYILFNNKRKEFFKSLRKGKFYELSLLRKNVHKSIICELYERGVLLEAEMSEREFLSASVKVRESKNKINAEIIFYPFYLNQSIKRVKLNPCYLEIA